MNYFIALFTSKVITDAQGRSIYIDPITKNGYLLKGKLARQKNILPIRAVFALFSFLIIYSLKPVVMGYTMWPVYLVAAIIGLIYFEYRLYTKILPNCSVFPNYRTPSEPKTLIGSKKRIVLIIAYTLFAVLLAIHAWSKQDLSITIAIIILIVVSIIRLKKLITND